MSPGIVEAVRIGEAGSSEKFKQWKSAKPGLPSGYVKIAIEKSPFIVDFPIKNGDFP